MNTKFRPECGKDIFAMDTIFLARLQYHNYHHGDYTSSHFLWTREVKYCTRNHRTPVQVKGYSSMLDPDVFQVLSVSQMMNNCCHDIAVKFCQVPAGDAINSELSTTPSGGVTNTQSASPLGDSTSSLLTWDQPHLNKCDIDYWLVYAAHNNSDNKQQCDSEGCNNPDCAIIQSCSLLGCTHVPCYKFSSQGSGQTLYVVQPVLRNGFRVPVTHCIKHGT